MKLSVKNTRDEMVHYSAFMKLDKVYGISEIRRHNIYTSTEISGSAAAGYISDTAIKVIQEVAAAKLPRGYDIDWAGISADEVSQGNKAIWVFRCESSQSRIFSFFRNFSRSRV